MPLFRLLTLILLLTVSHFARALSVDVNEAFSRQEIGEGVEFLVDPSAELTADNVNDQARWQLSTDTALNFGFSSDVYWVRFAIHNTGAKAVSLMLESRFPFLDHLDITVTSDHEPPAAACPG